MERLMDYCESIQHIGIPTEDLPATCKFYEDLGFENVYPTEIKSGQHVAFLQYGNLILGYEEAILKGVASVINHFAINCRNIAEAYQCALKKQYKILSNGIEELPFWKMMCVFYFGRHK